MYAIQRRVAGRVEYYRGPVFPAAGQPAEWTDDAEWSLMFTDRADAERVRNLMASWAVVVELPD